MTSPSARSPASPLVTALLAGAVALASGCSSGGDAPADASRPTDASVPTEARTATDAPAVFNVAATNGALAQPLLRHSRRWLTTELQHVDATSGLLNDPLDPGTPWSTQDTAADIYPFFVWSANLLAPEIFEAQARRALTFERASATLPATRSLPYSFDTRTQMRLDRGEFWLYFGAAEYVKDGLTPVVELTGRDAWFERMREIELDSFELGRFQTTSGRLPYDNLEASGDHMQSLPRLATMTGDTRYLEHAERVAEHYLGAGTFRPQSLRDHACEMIGGFALLYAVETQLKRPNAARYGTLLRAMLDYILDYGLTPEGFMHDNVHPATRGPIAAQRGTLSDNWGQNYVAFLIYAELANEPRYAESVDRALRSLWDPSQPDLARQPFHDYPWQGPPWGIDGLADAMEGATYLLAYRRVPEGQQWLDAEARLLDAMDWTPTKYGSNTVRTAILYARTKTLGTWVRPWREDVAWGAAWTSDDGRSVAVSVRADQRWSGRLVFDGPRYRETMGFARDYPRMNYLPAYFVVEPAARYRVTVGARSTELDGARLIEGHPLDISAGTRVDVLVERLR